MIYHKLISDCFDRSSIIELENFLLSCQKEISDGKLWIALQANAFADQNHISFEFDERFQQMIFNIENIFTIPNLTKNMRNSENINKASKGVIQTKNFFTVSNTIKKLPSLTTSSPQREPIVIPFYQRDFENNFKNMLDNEISNPEKKTMILHSNSYDGNVLRSLLLKSFPGIKPESVVKHDEYPNDATKNDLQSFLKQSEIKVGIFQSRLVTGMEGSNVIYFYDANDNINSGVRCSVTRAVSNLTIVLRVENNNSATTSKQKVLQVSTFENTKIDTRFIKCKTKFGKDDFKIKC